MQRSCGNALMKPSLTAHSSAFRSQHNATVMQRLRELRTPVHQSFVQLAITERDQRLIALQERWDGCGKPERLVRLAITPRR